MAGIRKHEYKEPTRNEIAHYIEHLKQKIARRDAIIAKQVNIIAEMKMDKELAARKELKGE